MNQTDHKTVLKQHWRLLAGLGGLIVLALLVVGVPRWLKGQPSVSDTWIRPADDMVMHYVPEGTFEMGSQMGDDDEKPVHTVTLSAFWIDQTPVTNAQYARCVEAGVCKVSASAGDDLLNAPDYPAVGIVWQDAQKYCAWAGGRLPTEAEWEYAARGPEGTRYPWGDEFDCSRCNTPGDACDDYELASPVGHFQEGRSWCGALDMAGNVWEWVADWYATDYYARSPAEDPTAPDQGEDRVMRGGSWADTRPEKLFRSANRQYLPSTMLGNYVGFRCAASVSQVP